MTAEAAEHLSELLEAARTEGVDMSVISGHRSYTEQKSLYERYRTLYGEGMADEISARPGYSEHQTGLAVDIGNADNACALLECFAQTPAGSWAANHARKYGFIIRYPQGAKPVTGYRYEPWHLRYVGATVAATLHDSHATLEEYSGLAPAPDYR